METMIFMNIICNGPWDNPSVQIIYPRMFTLFLMPRWILIPFTVGVPKKEKKHLRTF
jgi:hypothetical protein